jgi:hypothetical protein
MTRDELRAAMGKLDAEGLRLDAEEQAAVRPNPLAEARVRRATLREVGATAMAWMLATPEERREIVGHLVIEARITHGLTSRFTWRSASELAGRS